MLSLDDLIRLFHDNEFGDIVGGLSAKPANELSCEERYYLGVSLINCNIRLDEALEHLTIAEREGHSSPWLDYWRCHAYAKKGDFLSALTRASEQLASQPDFKPSLQFFVNIMSREDARTQLLSEPRFLELTATVLKAMLTLQGPSSHASQPSGQQEFDLDLLQILAPAELKKETFKLQTDHPVAMTSDDYLAPRGAMSDNSRAPHFVAACERAIGKNLKHMDLGCAGGGLVYDFCAAGHQSFGLEGSDYAARRRAHFWRVIPNRLRTCDITKPFAVTMQDGTPAAFDVITAWEVLEHIPEDQLDTLFLNIKTHLSPGGYFIASVAQFPDYDPITRSRWHVTLKSRSWWHDAMARHGLEMLSEYPFDLIDFVRGVGLNNDWDARANPTRGFHAVARRK